MRLHRMSAARVVGTKGSLMRGRILFVAGIAAGYVIGARAGRPAYDAVVERVYALSGDRRVQQVGDRVRSTLEEKAPRVADVAEKAAAAVTGAASAAKDAGSEESGSAQKPAGSAA
jgi:hypothetical protein